MSDNTLASEDTGSSETTNQATEKTYTQKEFDDHMARMKASITKKYDRLFAELGDPDELKQIKQDYEKRKVDEQKKRGEFDRILQELAERKDQEIKKRDEIIKNYTVDLPLVNAAAQYRAVNADQVKQLLKGNVRLNDSGEVEVLDTKGSVRYNDQGTPFRVEDLVKEFLDANPHFVAAPPSTTQGRSNIGQSQPKVDLKTLDMKNPEHRKLYREARSQITK